MNRNVNILVVILILVALAAGVLWRIQKLVSQSQKAADLAQQATEEQQKDSSGGVSIKPPALIDSSWQSYRNEKFGFEFKLSNSYKFGIDGQNISHVDDVFYYLDTGLRNYTFHSIEGTKILVEVAGRGDASDFWAIRTQIFDYSEEFNRDFKQWVFNTHDSNENDIESIGTSVLPDGRKVNYFCWVSIGGDCSVFFTNKKSIVEFNTEGTNFLSDGKPDYFSATLGSFRFFR